MSDPIEEPTPLTRSEKMRLGALGYKASHTTKLHPDLAREYITSKRYRPGSAAFNKQQPKELRVPDSMTDEAIEAKNKTLPKPSGVRIQIDEFTNQCVRGDNPLDAVLLEAEASHPGMRFRLINENLPPTSGPQFQPAYDENRKQIEVAGLKLGFMPETVYDEFYRKPNQKRSEQMMGAVTRGKEDHDVAIQGPDGMLAPIEGKGLQTEPTSNERLRMLAQG
jgi:hypothetical protein